MNNIQASKNFVSDHNPSTSKVELVNGYIDKKGIIGYFIGLGGKDKIYGLYCNFKETKWSVNENGIFPTGEVVKVIHLFHLSTNYDVAVTKAKNFMREQGIPVKKLGSVGQTNLNAYEYKTELQLQAEKKWRLVNTEIWGIRNIKRSVKKSSYKIADLRAKRLTPSSFVGEVGERSDFDLTLKFNLDFDSTFGRTWMNNLVDAKGNVFVYWGKCLGNKGDNIKLKATVKGHDVYKGVKQTNINRPKIIEETN